MKKITLLIVLAFLTFSCKNEAKSNDGISEELTNSTPEVFEETTPTPDANLGDAGYMGFTVNDDLAKKVAEFLKNDYLKSDYEFLTENDKKFQLAQVDLNNDGNNELFVNFFSSYFCGTGGCTLLLLNKDLKVITRFTVTQTPLFIQKEIVNGWNAILVKSQGKFVKLVYDGKSYPSNPSIVNPVDYAPSGHDLVLFDDNFSPSKNYTY